MEHSQRVRVRLQDILDEIAGIRSVTSGLSFEEFDGSWAALRATQHALLIVAEAVKNLPTEVKADRPEIPWERIRALGNLLRHEYASIDNARIWSIVTDHLTPLEAAARALLTEAAPPET
jgi:uncharacterized protein with HEPN domain